MDSTLLIYGAIMAFVVLVILRRPAVAFGAFLCTYGLEQWAQSQSAFFYQNGALTNYLTAAVLVWALAVRQVKGIAVGAVLPGVAIATFVLFTWSALSIAWALAPEYAWANWSKTLPYLVITLVLMPLVVASMNDLRAGLLMATSLGTLVLALLLLSSDWEGRSVVFKQGSAIGSIKSDTGNPLAVASLGGWVAIIALLARFRGVGRIWTIGRYPVFVLGMVIAIKSGSRGQLFALVLAGLAFYPFSRRIRSIGSFIAAGVGMILVLGIATVVFDTLVGESSDRWNFATMRDTWSDGRLGMSMVLLNEWTEAGPVAWLIGLGTSASYDPNLVGGYPHVVMAEVLGELGLIGFVMLWFVPILGFTAFVRLHRLVADDDENRGLVAVLGALFLFEVILSFKQGSLLGSPFAFGFAVVLGRLATLQRMAPAPQAPAVDGTAHTAFDQPATRNVSVPFHSLGHHSLDAPPFSRPALPPPAHEQEEAHREEPVLIGPPAAL